MSRYIDAEMLEEALAEQRDYNAPNLTALVNEAMTSAFRIAIREVNLVPTIDVEKVIHGRWVDLGDSEMCSACTGTKLKEFDTAYGKAMWVESKYCPNCGAKMDL